MSSCSVGHLSDHQDVKQLIVRTGRPAAVGKMASKGPAAKIIQPLSSAGLEEG